MAKVWEYELRRRELQSRMTEVWDAEDEADLSTPSTLRGTTLESTLLICLSDSSEEGELNDLSGKTKWSMVEFK